MICGAHLVTVSLQQSHCKTGLVRDSHMMHDVCAFIVADVDVGTFLYHEVKQFVVIKVKQRGSLVFVLGIRIATSVEKCSRAIDTVSPAGAMQGCEATCITRVNVSSPRVLREKSYGIDLASLSQPVPRCSAKSISAVDVTKL